MHRTLMQGSILGLLLWSLAGCAGVLPLRAPEEPPLRVATIGDIIETQTGRTIPFETLVDELARARIIYVGEMHTSAEDHRVQQQILRALLNRNPSVVLAMEMFPREVQPVLDRFAKGETSEEEFLKQVQWEKVWGFPYVLYKGMLDLAREKKIPILGLNAPRELVRKVGREGLASLSPEERSRVAELYHLEDPEHRRLIREEFDQHMKNGIRDFDTFFEAQLTWEETMAETLARTLTSLPPEAQILVLIGKGHIRGRHGVPLLTARRVKHPYRTVAPIPFNVPFSVADPNLADYVWLVDEAESPHRGRLGVSVQPLASGTGLEVNAVLPASPAAKAGIKKGDIIRTIDGTPVKSVEELRKAVAHGGPEHNLSIKRNGQDLSVPVTIEP